jgi:hypothetical protein
MKRPEQNIQIACINWFRMQYPRDIIFAIPNSAKRGKVEGGIMRCMGTIAGMPDVQVLRSTPDYYGLFVEFKAVRGSLSPAQKEIHEKLRERGYKVAICRSVDEFMDVVNGYMVKRMV